MPSTVPEAEADPFLMCDEFGPTPSKGAYDNDTDEGFDVSWCVRTSAHPRISDLVEDALSDDAGDCFSKTDGL